MIFSSSFPARFTPSESRAPNNLRAVPLGAAVAGDESGQVNTSKMTPIRIDLLCGFQASELPSSALTPAHRLAMELSAADEKSRPCQNFYSVYR